MQGGTKPTIMTIHKFITLRWDVKPYSIDQSFFLSVAVARDLDQFLYLSHVNCWTVASKFARFKSSRLQCEGILREKMYKTRIIDLQGLTTTPLTNGCCNDDTVQLSHFILTRCFSASTSVMSILNTFLYNMSHTL